MKEVIACFLIAKFFTRIKECLDEKNEKSTCHFLQDGKRTKIKRIETRVQGMLYKDDLDAFLVVLRGLNPTPDGQTLLFLGQEASLSLNSRTKSRLLLHTFGGQFQRTHPHRRRLVLNARDSFKNKMPIGQLKISKKPAKLAEIFGSTNTLHLFTRQWPVDSMVTCPDADVRLELRHFEVGSIGRQIKKSFNMIVTLSTVGLMTNRMTMIQLYQRWPVFFKEHIRAKVDHSSLHVDCVRKIEQYPNGSRKMTHIANTQLAGSLLIKPVKSTHHESVLYYDAALLKLDISIAY
ncbi:hypothetical protein T4B_2539 [Trichinella pseudospiralis]|uniref:Uncharacterized protein n=2 Tax=Trichinella pseudospiralis TaxID=6337 RepID=A0A0V1IRH9_TRIPS|nr:hypothetical protein T4A_5685 [Trichinella pseudospiralis]KRZ25284.1 hypothetical protein T4B_2539 [Trichinella pseudospiralis]KRZ36940.1 hypothetical protein T4C_4854 [Trichinella pseudospiralis]